MAKFVPLAFDQDAHDERIAESVHSRETEINNYNAELAGHEATILALGDISWKDFDGAIQSYSGLDREAAMRRAAQNNLPDEQVERISQLMFLEKAKHHRNCCRHELIQCIQHHENFKDMLPEGERRDTALAKVIAKRAGEKAVTQAEHLEAIVKVAAAKTTVDSMQTDALAVVEAAKAVKE